MTSIPRDPNLLTSDTLSDIDVTDQLSEFNMDDGDLDLEEVEQHLSPQNIPSVSQEQIVTKGQEILNTPADIIINRAIQRFKNYLSEHQGTYMAIIIGLIVMAILVVFTFIFSLCNVMALVRR